MTKASRFTAIFLAALTSAIAVSPALASHGQCSSSGSNSGSSNSGSNGSGGSQTNSNSGPGYPFLAR
jgi:hypothetical protein